MKPKLWPHGVNLMLAHLQVQVGKVRGQVSKNLNPSLEKARGQDLRENGHPLHPKA